MPTTEHHLTPTTIEILAKNVRHVSVPHYENLSLEKIRAFCLTKFNDVDSYMPDKKELHKISREWSCNVIATQMKNVFTDWVKLKIDERNEEMKDKKDYNIEFDEDIAAAFQASTSVSRK